MLQSNDKHFTKTGSFQCSTNHWWLLPTAKRRPQNASVRMSKDPKSQVQLSKQVRSHWVSRLAGVVEVPRANCLPHLVPIGTWQGQVPRPNHGCVSNQLQKALLHLNTQLFWWWSSGVRYFQNFKVTTLQQSGIRTRKALHTALQQVLLVGSSVKVWRKRLWS